jgi:hypothetical protein
MIAILEYITSVIQELTQVPVFIGELPASTPAIAIQSVGGGTIAQHHDTRRIMRLTIQLLIRHPDQQEGLSTLSAIAKELARKTDWIADENIQVTKVEQTTEATWLGQGDNADYLYSCLMQVNYYEF